MSHSTFLPSTFNGLPALDAAAGTPHTPGHTHDHRHAHAEDDAPARWPWVAIAGCVLMFAAMAFDQVSQARMARASQALHSTWLPTVEQLADVQLTLRDLSGEATQRSAWTPGQLRGRISDDLVQLAHRLAPTNPAMDAQTPELMRALQQRWHDYTALADASNGAHTDATNQTATQAATPEHAERLRAVAAALTRLSEQCLAQSQAQAERAAGH